MNDNEVNAETLIKEAMNSQAEVRYISAKVTWGDSDCLALLDVFVDPKTLGYELCKVKIYNSSEGIWQAKLKKKRFGRRFYERETKQVQYQAVVSFVAKLMTLRVGIRDSGDNCLSPSSKRISQMLSRRSQVLFDTIGQISHGREAQISIALGNKTYAGNKQSFKVKLGQEITKGVDDIASHIKGKIEKSGTYWMVLPTGRVQELILQRMREEGYTANIKDGLVIFASNKIEGMD